MTGIEAGLATMDVVGFYTYNIIKLMNINEKVQRFKNFILNSKTLSEYKTMIDIILAIVKNKG